MREKGGRVSTYLQSGVTRERYESISLAGKAGVSNEELPIRAKTCRLQLPTLENSRWGLRVFSFMLQGLHALIKALV
jgi:hypothetical protein